MTHIGIIFFTLLVIFQNSVGAEKNFTATIIVKNELSRPQHDMGPNSQLADPCNTFTYGLNDFEFASPLYPDDYPPDLDCVKQITAEPGFVIQIQFIDRFQIEDREDGVCKYDYLEVRDGEFAASPLKEKLCGGIAPFPYLQSTGRWLWLRFHSDTTIGYGGFKATITFVPAKGTQLVVGDCSGTFTSAEGLINSTAISDEVWQRALDFGLPVDCTWVIQAEKGKKIFLQFSTSELTLEKPNHCPYNFIQIYKSQKEFEGTEKDGEPEKKCGSTISNQVKSSDNLLAIRFYSMVNPVPKSRSKFEANFTIQRDSSAAEPCNKDEEFDCKDGSCILKTQQCNGLINCARPIDEEKCADQTHALTADILVIAFIGCLLIAGMCGGLILNIYRKLRQDRLILNQMKENMRKSRESMGNVSDREGERVPSVACGKMSTCSDSVKSKDTVIEMRPIDKSQNVDTQSQQVTMQMPKIITTVDIYTQPSPPPTYPKAIKFREPEQNQNQNHHLVEVRDCGTQTRESLRAPLARGEAFDSTPVRKIVRLMHKNYADIVAIYPALSSASSETGRSLESLDRI